MKTDSGLFLALVISAVIHIAALVAFLTRLTPVEYGVAKAPSSIDIVVLKGENSQGNYSKNREINQRINPHEFKDNSDNSRERTEENIQKKAEKVIQKRTKDVFVSKRESKKNTIKKKKVLSQQKNGKNVPLTHQIQYKKNNNTPQKLKGTLSLHTSSYVQGTPIDIPAYLKNNPPKYPRLARKLGYEGTVILNVTVLSNGKPKKLEVEKSSGYEILDKAAIEAVKKWKFKPATRGGIPINSEVKIPIKFDLKQG